MGYTPAGAVTPVNDLYRSGANGALAVDQTGTILGEWKRFLADPVNYDSYTRPDCTALMFDELWDAHASHRLDPKYHLFKIEAKASSTGRLVRDRLGTVLQRREEPVEFAADPDRLFTVMTITQTGDIRPPRSRQGPESAGMAGFILRGGAPVLGTQPARAMWFSRRSISGKGA